MVELALFAKLAGARAHEEGAVGLARPLLYKVWGLVFRHPCGLKRSSRADQASLGEAMEHLARDRFFKRGAFGKVRQETSFRIAISIGSFSLNPKP